MAWVTGVLVLLACGLGRALMQDGMEPATFAGYVVGAAVLPLAAAAVLWWVGSRIVRRPRPVSSPWVALTAAALAVVVLAGEAGRRAAEPDTATADAGERCLDPQRPFGAQPEGLTYEPAPQADAVRRAMASADGPPPREIEVRAVEERGDLVAYLMAFVPADERQLDDEEEMAAGARSQGARTRRGRVAGRAVLIAEGPDSAAIYARKDCALVGITSVDMPTVRFLARHVLR